MNTDTKETVKRIRTKTLIVGAGPAGLSCAMELCNAKEDFIVIEKQSAVGGLSKTYTYKEDKYIFRTDNGPHRFFSKNPKLYIFIENIINEKWISVKRQTRQYIDGKFYDYPINFFQALRNLGILKSIGMSLDYIFAKIKYRIFKSPIKNFKDYVYANFGKGLGLFSMIHYTEKIWGIPSHTIHPDWATQRIKGLNLFKVITDAVKRLFGLHSKNSPKSLVDTFYYPQYGTGLIYETILSKIKQAGYRVILNANTKEFIHKDGKIIEVLVKTPDGDMIIEFDNLVETIPLPTFVNLLSPKVDNSLVESAKALKHRSQVYLFITIDKDSITKDQWIYFPDKNVPFARISEMKNFSKDMSPKGKTSIFVEYFCFEGDHIWNMTEKQLFDLTMTHFEKMKFFQKRDVRRYYLIKLKDVYPIYDLEYKKYLNHIKEFLNGFSNLYYIGRPGRFRYNNQDHSLEMGLLAAKSIIDGVKYDIESVGEEKEYQESGKLYEKAKS